LVVFSTSPAMCHSLRKPDGFENSANANNYGRANAHVS
jgi:hypothetical protein